MKHCLCVFVLICQPLCGVCAASDEMTLQCVVQCLCLCEMHLLETCAIRVPHFPSESVCACVCVCVCVCVWLSRGVGLFCPAYDLTVRNGGGSISTCIHELEFTLSKTH